jgi:hypothetical protein
MKNSKKKMSDRERCTNCMYRAFITGNSNRNPKNCKKVLKKKPKFRLFIRKTIKDADIDNLYPLHSDCPIKALDLL